jgi:hypothetical protein
MNSFDGENIIFLDVSLVCGKICKICSTGWYVYLFSTSWIVLSLRDLSG